MKYWEAWLVTLIESEGCESLLQKPDSRPTLKQLASALKFTERALVGAEVSIGPRTFILVKC